MRSAVCRHGIGLTGVERVSSCGLPVQFAAHSIRSTNCERSNGASYGSGQNSTIFVILPSSTVKKEIALARSTPSVTETSDTASPSPPVPLLRHIMVVTPPDRQVDWRVQQEKQRWPNLRM